MMTCTKCKRPIEPKTPYHRTKKGPHHRDCMSAFAQPTLLGWRSEPPNKSGMWWVRQKNKKHEPPMIEVKRFGRRFRWSFIDGMTWNPVDEYPQYEWCGPLVPPS